MRLTYTRAVIALVFGAVGIIFAIGYVATSSIIH